MPKIYPILLVLALLAAPAAADAPYIPPTSLLSDDITYTVHWDGTYDYEEAVTTRLNTANAVQDSGQADIYNSGSPDDLILLNAYTLTPSGQRVDVLPGQMLDQGINDDDDDVYTNGTRKVIFFPDLSPGAIEHYHYILKAIGTYFPGQFFAEENFPVSSDTQSASVTLTAPDALNLSLKAVGMQGGEVADAKPGQRKWVFTLHNVAAEPPEPDTVAVSDFSPGLDATTFPNYAAAGAAFEQTAADKAAVTPVVQALANNITQGVATSRAQAQALYDWVSRNIHYTAIDLGYNGYIPNPADQIIAAGYGDCKDHVTLLRALLAAKHIPSTGALVNSDDGYVVPSIALPIFDHIITYIPQFNLFLDSTAQFAPFGVLPAQERGKQALITGGQGIPSRLVTLPLSQAVPDVSRDVTLETLAQDGTISGTAEFHNSGRYELYDRNAFGEANSANGAPDATQLMVDFGELGSGAYTYAVDPYDLSKPFVFSAKFSLPEYAVLPGPGTMQIPLGIPHGLVVFPRLTALPVRIEAMHCPPEDNWDKILLRLPTGFSVKFLPPNLAFTNAIGSYTAKYGLYGNTIQVNRHLWVHPSGAVCSPSQYQQLRALSFVIERDLRAVITY